MIKKKELFYTIETVSKLTGLSSFTLRNWERRFGFPKPQREANGYRTYAIADVRVLKQLSQLLQAGRKINDLMAILQSGQPLPEVIPFELSPHMQEQLDSIYQHLIRFDVERAELSLSNLIIGMVPRISMQQVYQPLLVRIGREWSENKICIAQEHFASAFLRLHISPFLSGGTTGSVVRKKALFTTIEKEYHEGGLMIMAIQLKLRGWGIYYLGTNLPATELEFATKAIKPHLVCLSCADPELLEPAIPELQKLPVLVCAGGSGIKSLKDPERLPENIFAIDSSAEEAADLLDCLSTEYLEKFFQ